LEEGIEESDFDSTNKEILQATAKVSCRSNDLEIVNEGQKSIDSVKVAKLEVAQLAIGYFTRFRCRTLAKTFTSFINSSFP